MAQITTVRQKPFGSRIQLKKDGENVEILIPSKKLMSFLNTDKRLTRTLWYLGLVLWPSICIILEIQERLSFILFWAALFSLSFGVRGLGVLLEESKSFFRTTRININNKQISVTCLWLGYKYQAAPIRKKSLKEGRMYTRHSIESSEINEYYELIENSKLTPPEREWLAAEISAISNGKITMTFADL